MPYKNGINVVKELNLKYEELNRNEELVEIEKPEFVFLTAFSSI